MAVCALGWGGSSASADAELSTIYLQNGGKLRGEIVIDMPGAPLTVMVAGQALQVPRESIARIDSGATAPAAPAAPALYAAQPAPVPVAVPVAAPAPAPLYTVAPPPSQPAPPPAPAAPTAGQLQLDPQGRAAIDPSWSPELQQLVSRRNDVSYSLKRKGFGGPVVLMGLGLLGLVITAAATNAAAEKCVEDIYDYGSTGCIDAVSRGRAAGYALSSVMLGIGSIMVIARLVRKSHLKRQLALIDADLNRFSVRAIARLNPVGGSLRGTAGLTLRASF